MTFEEGTRQYAKNSLTKEEQQMGTTTTVEGNDKKQKRAYGTGGIYTKTNRRGEVTYYVAYRVNGKAIRECTGSAKEADAERLLQKRKGEIQDGAIACSPLRLKVNGLLDDLLADYTVRGLSSLKTITTHIEGEEYGLRKIFGHMKPSAVTKPVLNKAVIGWQELELMPATINKHLGTLRRAFNLAVENRKIGRGMVPDVPYLPENNARQTYVGVSDMAHISTMMPDDGTRDFVNWLHESSQRWGEAAAMEWAWFNHETWEIRVPGTHTKNGLPRVIPVIAALRPIIERRLAARRLDCPYIFHRNGKKIHPSWLKVWRKSCRQAGFGGTRAEGITPHDLRHIAATDMRRAGIPESIILKIGGWETASMFRRYAITDTQEIADNLAKLSRYRAKARKQPARVMPMPSVKEAS